MAPTSTGTSPLRVLVVYDKQPNGAAPAATDILAADTIQSVNNLSNSRRFVTLCDEIIPCIGTQGPGSDHRVIYKKLNQAVEFNAGSAGTVADIQTGSVYMLTYQNANILVAAPTGAVVTRLRFSDN